MRIVLTQHGEKRLRQRGSSNSDLQAVITQPDIKVNRADGCVEYVGRTHSGRRLKVVLNEGQNPPELVTAHWQEE